MRQITILAPVLCCMALAGSAQPKADSIKQNLDAYIQKAITAWRVPGISIAITRGDSIIYSMASGYADIDQRRPVTTKTIFPVGSMGKSFTAFSLSLLQQQGKLSLHDKVIHWLPWLEIKSNELSNGLMISDILSHRTGMETFAGDLIWTESGLDTKTMLNKWGRIPPAFPIRSRFGYSNFGYMAAGEIINAAAQVSWQQYTKEQILQPLQMQHSFLLYNEANAYRDIAVGYTAVDDSIVPVPAGTGVLQAFGGMYSTAEDIAKWVMMHANDGRYNNVQLFPEGAVWDVRNPYTIIGKAFFPNGKRLMLNYGLGWEMFNYNNTEVVCHGGAYSGFLSMMGFIPELKAGFAILTNSDSHELTEALRWKIIDILLGNPSVDYSADMLNFVQHQQKEMNRITKQMTDSASMQIKLPFSIEQYAGTYSNDVYGNIFLKPDGNELVLTMEHHHSITARLTYIGNNRFYCVFNHPMFGKTVWPFAVSNGKVTGLTLSVHPFLEFTTYHFSKVRNL